MRLRYTGIIALITKFEFEQLYTRVMSLINKTKSTGPKMLPRGTPSFGCSRSDPKLTIETNYIRSDKKALTKFSTFPRMS